MKSEISREYLSRTAMSPNSPLAQDAGFVWGDAAVIKAVELAEQEAEERVRTRAIEAFKKMCPFNDQRCKPDCDGCNRLKRFIQRIEAK